MKMMLHYTTRNPLPAIIAVLMLVGCAQDSLVAPEMPQTASSIPMLATSAATVAATGDFTVTSAVPVAVTPDDGSCVIELLATFEFVGSLEGAFTAVFEIEHDGLCGQAAEEKFEVRGTYEGSVAGVDGSYPFEFEGTIDAQGHAQGSLEMEAGSIEAKLELTGTAGVAGTYTGYVKVDD